MTVSLLVSSAAIGASLIPLPAQTVTTENIPVVVEFVGGTSSDGNGVPNMADPDPMKPDSSFDLPFIPREYDFGKSSISNDLTKLIPNKTDEERAGNVESVSIGDMRGSKKSWYVTARLTGMKLGEESLEGSITTGAMFLYLLAYNEEIKTYDYQSTDLADPVTKPETVDTTAFSIALDGDAMLLADTTVGKRQGLWQFSFRPYLNTTTPVYNIEAGAYTGNITWNLIVRPSI